MLKKYWNIFIEVSFSPWGIAGWSVVGGGIMWLLTSITSALQTYAPLSYGIAVVCGILSVIVILRGAISIWIAFNQRIFTKKPTFIEYKIENGKINLVKQSNIYQEPTCIFQNNFMLQQQDNVVSSSLNRKQKRAQNAVAQPIPAIKKPSSARIIAIFDKPISSSSMLTRLEGIHGVCPSREASSITERWATIAISNIGDNCCFRIYFNSAQEENQS